MSIIDTSVIDTSVIDTSVFNVDDNHGIFDRHVGRRVYENYTIIKCTQDRMLIHHQGKPCGPCFIDGETYEKLINITSSLCIPMIEIWATVIFGEPVPQDCMYKVDVDEPLLKVGGEVYIQPFQKYFFKNLKIETCKDVSFSNSPSTVPLIKNLSVECGDVFVSTRLGEGCNVNATTYHIFNKEIEKPLKEGTIKTQGDTRYIDEITMKKVCEYVGIKPVQKFLLANDDIEFEYVVL